MFPIHVPPALHHRGFRLIWLGQMVSIAGTQMQISALHWHIRELTDQPIYLGGIGLARILPVIVFSLIGGAIADVANRRRVMLITQSAMALLAALLALLTARGHVALWHIYLLTAMHAVAVSFDLPARQALVPALVPAAVLPNAFSLISIAQQTGAILGPALSGPVIAHWGQAAAYGVNAASYLAVILALLFMGPVGQEKPAANRPVVSRQAIGEGVRFILAHPIILSTMLIDFFATFFSSANTLMPSVARDVLGVGVVEYGWLTAAQSIGAVLAAIVLSQLNQIRRQGPIFLTAVMVFGMATIAFGLSSTFLLAMAALIVIGAADAVSTVIRNTIRQLQTPDYIRGRMLSINQLFFMGGPQLGEVEAGLAAQLFGVPFAIVSGGLGCLVAVTWIARRWPQLRSYDGSEPMQAAAAD